MNERDEPLEEGEVDRALEAAWGASSGELGGDPRGSVLGAIERLTGAKSRVLLRDAPDDTTPVVRLPGREGAADAEEDSRYQVMGEMARGGVGLVYKGRDKDLGRFVALKVLRPEHLGNPSIVERFVEEAQIGGQLQHPGIVPVYDLGLQSGNRPYFAMKLVKGKTLAALLAERDDLTADRAKWLGVFLQVAQTMAYAHARGVIHRDLKPSNVMIGAYGEVVLVDWGFAKVLSTGGIADEDLASRLQTARSIIETVRSGSEGSSSVAGSLMGTPGYMPPEQARGDVEKLDERSDVFGLGAILCEILTGQPPYTGPREEIYRAALHGRLDDAYGRLDACGADAELVTLTKECLSPAPLGRPKDAQAVADAVGSHLAKREARIHAAEIAAAEAAAVAVHERRARRRTVVLGTVVVVALLLGGFAFWWTDRQTRDRELRVARTVATALDEAQLLRGEARGSAVGDVSRWPQVVSAADRALQFAETGEADASTVDRARRFKDEVLFEKATAESAAHQAKDDRRFAGRLLDIALRRGDGYEPAAKDVAYREAFVERGLDVEAGRPDDVASRIRESDIRVDLVRALDDWMLVRRAIDAPTSRLLAILHAADPDADRTSVRELAAENDLDGLHAFVAKQDLEALPVETLLLEGDLLAEGEPTEKALALLRAAQRRVPADPWSNARLAHALIASEDADGALRFLSSARAMRPDLPALAGVLGDALHASGDVDGALDAWREAVSAGEGYEGLVPRLTSALVDLAQTYFLGARQDLAARRVGVERLLREAIALDESCAVAWWHLSRLHTRLAEAGPAAECSARAVELEPEDTAYLVRHGQALESAGDLAAALAAYGRALELEPVSNGALWGRLRVLRRLKRYGEALEILRTVREIPAVKASGAVRVQFTVELGEVALLLGDLDSAIEAFREVASRARGDSMRFGDPGVYVLAHYLLLYEAGRAEEGAAVWREDVTRREGLLDSPVAQSGIVFDRRKWSLMVHLARCPEPQWRDDARVRRLRDEARAARAGLASETGPLIGMRILAYEARVHHYLGEHALALDAWNRWEAARREFLEKNPGLKFQVQATVHLWRAESLLQLGRGEEAREALDEGTRALEEEFSSHVDIRSILHQRDLAKRLE